MSSSDGWRLWAFDRGRQCSHMWRQHTRTSVHSLVSPGWSLAGEGGAVESNTQSILCTPLNKLTASPAHRNSFNPWHATPTNHRAKRHTSTSALAPPAEKGLTSAATMHTTLTPATVSTPQPIRATHIYSILARYSRRSRWARWSWRSRSLQKDRQGDIVTSR